MSSTIRSYRDLKIYQRAFELQQLIFEISKKWPKEEQYGLTGQVRRSSRSVGGNLAETWSKRKYRAHFHSKLTDVDGELAETRHWVDTARACGYVSDDERSLLEGKIDEIGRMVGKIMQKEETFVP
jgi:four helix bundle protein